jgi:hypothetical protein
MDITILWQSPRKTTQRSTNFWWRLHSYSNFILLILWIQTSFSRVVMRSFKNFPRVNEMPTLTYNRFDLIWLIWFNVFNATFSNVSTIMATRLSGGRSRSTRREPPTMGKQLVNFITCGCESNAPFFYLHSWAQAHAVLVIGLYELLSNPTYLTYNRTNIFIMKNSTILNIIHNIYFIL